MVCLKDLVSEIFAAVGSVCGVINGWENLSMVTGPHFCSAEHATQHSVNVEVIRALDMFTIFGFVVQVLFGVIFCVGVGPCFLLLGLAKRVVLCCAGLLLCQPSKRIDRLSVVSASLCTCRQFYVCRQLRVYAILACWGVSYPLLWSQDLEKKRKRKDYANKVTPVCVN